MKNIVVILFLYFFTFSVSAQELEDSILKPKKTYFSLGLSINPIGANSSKWVTDNINSTDDATQKVSNYSLGKSIGLNSSFGLFFSKNIGAEIGMSYVLGMGNSYEYAYYYSSINSYERIKGAGAANNFSISPKLVFNLNQRESGGFIYTKVGYQMGFANIMYNDKLSRIDENKSSFTANLKWKQTGKPVHGSVFCIGYTFKENPKTNSKIFIELEISNASMKPVKSELVSLTSSGVNTTEFQSENFKTIYYKDEITYDSADNDPNQPRERLAIPLNFSYVGMKVGWVF